MGESKVVENTKAYWDGRFNENWKDKGGAEQTEYFYNLLLEMLPMGLRKTLSQEHFSILDVGCATGEGSSILKKAFDGSCVTGMDFSTVAVEKASREFPQCRFVEGDARTTDLEADVVVVSNVLEHLTGYEVVLQHLFDIARHYLIVMVPFCDEMEDPEHVNRFTLDSFPVVKGDFRAIHSAVRLTDPRFWKGSQLIVVYQRGDGVVSLGDIAKGIPLQYLLMNAFADLSDQYLKGFGEADFERFSLEPPCANRRMLAEVFYWKLLHKVKTEECFRLEWEKAQCGKQIISLTCERDLAQQARDEAERARDEAERARDEAVAKVEAAFAVMQELKLRKCAQLSKMLLLFKRPEELGGRSLLRAVFERLAFGRRLAPGFSIFSPVEDALRGQNNYSAAGVSCSPCRDWVGWANGWTKTVIMTCAFEYNELVNQRPINAAKWFSDHGYRVLYVAWQWSPDEKLLNGCCKISEGIYQVPLFEFLRWQGELVKRQGEQVGLFLLSLPADCLLDVAAQLVGRGYSVQYDIMDDWEQFFRSGQAPWYKADVEKSFVQLSDRVYAVSEALAEKFSDIRSDISVIGNGYSERVLKSENRFIAVKSDGKTSGGRLRVGYFGHLTDAWFDWDLVFALADDGRFDIDIIGYGMPEKIEKRVRTCSAINYIGKIQPADLHKYTATWRCAILPFKESKLSLAVDPIKIYEYIYFGLSTVVTGMPQLGGYSNTHCVQARDFVKTVASVCNGSFDVNDAESFLKETSWESRFERMERESQNCSKWRSFYV